VSPKRSPHLTDRHHPLLFARVDRPWDFAHSSRFDYEARCTDSLRPEIRSTSRISSRCVDTASQSCATPSPPLCSDPGLAFQLSILHSPLFTLYSSLFIHSSIFTAHSSLFYLRPLRLVPLDEVTPSRAPLIPQFRNDKIVYRRYAGLFFCVCVDSNDNELAYLEAIHLFVEVLGEYGRGLAWYICPFTCSCLDTIPGEARLLLRFCFLFALARLGLSLRCSLTPADSPFQTHSSRTFASSTSSSHSTKCVTSHLVRYLPDHPLRWSWPGVMRGGSTTRCGIGN
jgi:hypothetical protein